MSQSSFNIKIGDLIIFSGPNDSSFEKNGRYRILTINKFGEYPFNEEHHNKFSKGLNNPLVLTIKDKNNKTFILTYTDDGFYHDNIENWNYRCNFNTFDIIRRLRKEKLDEINKK